MTKKELCDCIVAVARSPSEDEQVNKMVMDLIDQYITDHVAALPKPNTPQMAYKAGEVRKIILKLLSNNQTGTKLTIVDLATALYGGVEHRQRDAARATLFKLISTGHVRKEGKGFEITRTGLALYTALVAKTSNPGEPEQVQS